MGSLQVERFVNVLDGLLQTRLPDSLVLGTLRSPDLVRGAEALVTIGTSIPVDAEVDGTVEIVVREGREETTVGSSVGTCPERDPVEVGMFRPYGDIDRHTLVASGHEYDIIARTVVIRRTIEDSLVGTREGEADDVQGLWVGHRVVLREVLREHRVATVDRTIDHDGCHNHDHEPDHHQCDEPEGRRSEIATTDPDMAFSANHEKTAHLILL